MKNLKQLMLSASFALIFTACSKKQADMPQPTTPPSTNPPATTVTTANVNYTNYVGSLLQSKCSACHAAGASASARWTFSGYASVTSNATRINNVTLVTKTMPQGGSLSASEQELLKAWFDKNMPQQ